MRLIEIAGRRYAQFERLADVGGLVHAYSTRPNDVSARTDARAPERDARRRQMAADLGFDAAKLCYCVQAHRTELAIIDAPDAGRRLEDYDAVVTDQPGVPIMTFSADCPLIIAFDPLRRVVGLVHASWRCTCAFATRQLIETMQRRMGCDPRRMLAGIGPSAGPERYEVKDDVFAAAADLPQRERFFIRRGERMFFDLWSANRAQLEASGLRAENIEVAGVCTMTDTETFYSFRREGAGCGHFGLMAGLV